MIVTNGKPASPPTAIFEEDCSKADNTTEQVINAEDEGIINGTHIPAPPNTFPVLHKLKDCAPSRKTLSDGFPTKLTIPARQKRRLSTYWTIPLSEDIPHIPVSSILLLPPVCPKRQTRLRSSDEFPEIPLGDPIIQKLPESARLFFQNVKGLTYTSSGNDYARGLYGSLSSRHLWPR